MVVGSGSIDPQNDILVIEKESQSNDYNIIQMWINENSNH